MTDLDFSTLLNEPTTREVGKTLDGLELLVQGPEWERSSVEKHVGKHANPPAAAQISIKTNLISEYIQTESLDTNHKQ